MNEIRLPDPNSDLNNWGDLLNSYMRVSHNEDGTPSAIGPISSSGLWIDVRDFGVRTLQDIQPGEQTGDIAIENDEAFEMAIMAALNGPDDPAVGVRTCTATVLLPPGDILISKPIRIYGVFNFQLEGIGQSRIMTEVEGLEALLDLNGIANCSFRNIKFTTRNDGSVIDVIRVGWNPEISSSSTRQNTFHNLQVFGKFVHGINIGFESENLQVDNDSFMHCTVIGDWLEGETNWWQTGFLMGSGTHGNNLNHTILHGVAGRCRYGVRNRATNIQMFGGALDLCGVSYLHESAGTSTLTGLRIENSQRLLQTSIAGWYANVTLDSIIFTGQRIHSDGKWIDFHHQGCLRLNNILLLQPKDKAIMNFDPAGEATGKVLSVLMDGCSTPYSILDTFTKVDAKVDVVVRGYTTLIDGRASNVIAQDMY